MAYNTADLDDAFTAGMLTAEDAAQCVPQYRAIHEAVETQFPGATDRERFQESLRQLVDSLVSGLIQGTVQAAREAGVESPAEVRKVKSRIAAFTPEAAATSAALKRFLHAKVYDRAPLAQDRQRSMAMIGELFDFFLEEPGRLPLPYAEQASGRLAPRVVCDYIAGMTDVFFRRTYEQLIGSATPPTS